jgi:hypothetical protein
MVLYSCVLIVFSLHQESFKLILVDEPPSRGGFVTVLQAHANTSLVERYRTHCAHLITTVVITLIDKLPHLSSP